MESKFKSMFWVSAPKATASSLIVRLEQAARQRQDDDDHDEGSVNSEGDSCDGHESVNFRAHQN